MNKNTNSNYMQMGDGAQHLPTATTTSSTTVVKGPPRGVALDKIQYQITTTRSRQGVEHISYVIRPKYTPSFTPARNEARRLKRAAQERLGLSTNRQKRKLRTIVTFIVNATLAQQDADAKAVEELAAHLKGAA